MRHKLFKITLLGSSMLILAGCVTPGSNVDMSGLGGAEAHYRGDVNHAYKSGNLLDISEEKVPGLDELINIKKGKDVEPENPEDKLRYPALREAALSYGARGGLSYTSRQINKMLQDRAPEFNRIYDFSKVVVPGPEGTTVLPPVISEAKDAYEMADGGKTLRLADSVYEIIDQARFTPVAPLWHGYLVREYSPPTPPPNALLPRNDGERDLWRRWVTEGWMKGVEQAHEIFQADLNRLERDFTGMIRYRQLHAQGKVSEPLLADTNLGVTGTGQDMRVNDRALRITRESSLETDPSKWSSSVSPMTSEEAATPPGKEKAAKPENYVKVEDFVQEEVGGSISQSLSNIEAIDGYDEMLPYTAASAEPTFSYEEAVPAPQPPAEMTVAYQGASPDVVAPLRSPVRETAPPTTQKVVPGPGEKSQRERHRLQEERQRQSNSTGLTPPTREQLQGSSVQPRQNLPEGVSVRRF